MARYLCDTSALVAAVSTWHERHDRTRTELQRRTDAGEELVLAAHSLVETYAVLTRLPGHRLRVDDAIASWQNSANETQAQAAASQFQLAGAEELPYIPLMNQNATFVHNNKVHGWQPFVWNLYPYYNDTWIEA